MHYDNYSITLSTEESPQKDDFNRHGYYTELMNTQQQFQGQEEDLTTRDW